VHDVKTGHSVAFVSSRDVLRLPAGVCSVAKLSVLSVILCTCCAEKRWFIGLCLVFMIQCYLTECRLLTQTLLFNIFQMNMRLFPLDFLSPLFQTYTPFGTHQNNATHRVFVLHYVCSIQFQRCMDINVYVHFRAQIEGIFCVPISCEIPRRYRDIVVKFHGPFAGSAPSCSWSESGRKLTTSVSPFLLLHDGCSRDYTSRPVCSTSSYTARHFVHICNCSLSES